MLEAPVAIEPIGMVDVPELTEADLTHMHCTTTVQSIDEMSDPDLAKGLMLTPGERADVIVTFLGDPGDRVDLEWHDHKRGRHSACINEETGMMMLGHPHTDGQAVPMTLMSFQLTGTEALAQNATEYIPPDSLADIEPIDTTNATVLPVIFGHTNPDVEGNLSFFATMNEGVGVSYVDVTPEIAPTVSVGDTRIIEVSNMTIGDHNFHIHGFVFQHIETEYVDMDNTANNFTVPAERLENKDTIILPGRPAFIKGRSRTVTRLAISFDDTGREGQILASGKVPTDTESGGWLFHCHILEHSALGMTNFLQIVE